MKRIDDYIKMLERYPVRQFPKAGIFIVNQLAFESRVIAVKEINKRMIVRNKFVPNRIQFQTSPRTIDPRQIKSAMGALTSVAFMADQEYGFTEKPSRGKKIPIPTRAARVGKSIQRIKRSIYRTSKMSNLRKINKYKGKNKKQKIIAMLQDMASKKDKRPALIPFTRKPGIYVIKNIRRRKMSTRFTFKMHKLYDLSKSRLIVKPNPWMRPTLKKIEKRQGKIAEMAWQKFLSRV